MIKVTFEFSLNKAAYTEVHWFTGLPSQPQQDLLAAAYTTLRVAMLGGSAILTAVRFSDSTKPRAVRFLSFSQFTSASPLAVQLPNLPPTTQAMPANVSVQLLFNTSGPNKNMFIAGVPEEIVSTQGGPLYNLELGNLPSWVTAFDAWRAFLTAGQWGMLGKAPTSPTQAVVTWGVQPFPALACFQSTVALPLLAQGKNALLKGFRRINPRAPGITGVHTCLSSSAAGTPPIYSYFFGDITATQAQNSKLIGTISDMGYTVYSYNTITPKKASTRKRGGSLGQPRGRSLTRR